MLSTPSITEETPKKFGSGSEWMAFVVLALAGLVFLSNNVADPDLWGHVQFGRDVLQSGEIKSTTTYSYTAEGYRWVNHENLSELILAFTYDNVGLVGLIAGKFLLAIFILFLIVVVARSRGVGWGVLGAACFLVAANLESFWHFRPQIASFVFCAMMLAVFEYCFHDWQAKEAGVSELFRSRFKWLWSVPLILFLWANSHGGFVAGLAIVGTYLTGRIVELIWARNPGALGWSVRLAMVGVAGVLATFVNPYSFGLHEWLLSSLGQPRPEIQDWLPIDWFSTSGTRFAMMVSASVVALWMTRRHVDRTQVLVLLLVGWQACSHVRHIAFFALLFAFWMPVHLQDLLTRVAEMWPQCRTQATRKKSNGLRSLVFGAVVAGLLAVIGFRLSDVPVDKANYPVEAFEFIANNELDGRMVVTYNWAQYVIGAFGGEHEKLPTCPVSFDGRFRTCYSQSVVDMNFDFIIHEVGPRVRYRSSDSGPVDPERVLEFGAPDLVLISRRQLPAIETMGSLRDDWCLLYQDKVAQLWGRKSRFDDPLGIDFLPESDRRISEREQKGTVTWPAFPTVAGRCP